MNPKISIGLPVYNGKNYLGKAIDSILSQTFSDFELIISDNASTDSTEEICREYAKKDSRVHYHRNEKNVGIARNYNITYELSSPSSEYFKWAAHDDVLLPTYLATCVEVLDKDPSVVCVHTLMQGINEHDTVTKNYPGDQFEKSSECHSRFYDAVCIGHQVIVGHALIRKSVLDKTKLFGGYPGSDWALQAELSLYGRLFTIPEYLFQRRSHPDRAYRVPLYERIAIEDPTKEGKLVLPAWWQWFGYFQGINRAKLPLKDKIRCSIHAFKCFKRGILFYKLARDLKWAAKQMLHRKAHAVTAAFLLFFEITAN